MGKLTFNEFYGFILNINKIEITIQNLVTNVY